MEVTGGAIHARSPEPGNFDMFRGLSFVAICSRLGAWVLRPAAISWCVFHWRLIRSRH